MPARSHSGRWPEGLTDEEAIQRLQTLCLGACDGIQDLADDARYKALRRALIARVDLRPLAPAFVAAQPNLEAFVRHVRQTKNRTERREAVRTAFEPLWQEIRGSTEGTAPKQRARSRIAQQAAAVRALAPAALEAVAQLIDEEATRLDNGGPVEPARREALSQLRRLHAALGELIRLAETDAPLGTALDRLRSVRHDARTMFARMAAATPVTGSVLIAFGTVAGIADVFGGNAVLSLAAGTLAGTTMKDAMIKNSPTRNG